MLFKAKLRVTEIRMLPFPDHLEIGCFFPVSSPEGKDGTTGGSGTELGEEMETFLSDAIPPGDHVAGGANADGVGLWEDDTPREICSTVHHGTGPVVASIEADDESGQELETEISRKTIDLEALQKIASCGLPSGRGGTRALVWKLLLGYLPANRDLWDGVLSEKRAAYIQLISELILDPSRSTGSEEFPRPSITQDARRAVGNGQLERYVVSNGEHPLSLVEASVWHQYFQDSGITEQVDRDILRTHPDIRFFAGDSTFTIRNRESIRRILLLFAKLYPAIGYVQGMNEILAPLFYVFRTDPDVQEASHAEADSFYCFVILLSDSVDHFCPQLDDTPLGILSTLSGLSELLSANDKELWRHLEVSNQVKPQFYGFRWITLLLTQEFEFPTVLRVWDSLLGSLFGVQEMLLRVCCAMLVCAREELLEGDFAANLKFLQHYPNPNRLQLERLLRVAQNDVTVPRDWGLHRHHRKARRQTSSTPHTASGPL